MSKRTRQYIGLMSAILAYYIIHEGAHLIYALITGTFKQINIMGLGMQIDIHAERMTDIQLGVFCLVGSVATFVTAYVLVLCANKIGENSSKIFKACMYYITIAMLLIDPIYLSVLCGFFGGGDMNGISLLFPEIAVRIVYGIILAINIAVFVKIVLPKYQLAFSEQRV
ncbi:MAG: hypothetical protein IKW30_01820 [Lachnospiraceae bacterium]|nr:hypothetical protein [Lachnospiraceae bacterium]